MDKVSVIIPTYNRFKYLLNTIESVKKQTYTNLEIIVINDKSTQKEYYEYDFNRNKGIELSSGKYIAFCDDDDIWFPNKIEFQLKAMQETGCKMSSTDGLIGNGIFNLTKSYKKYNAEYHYKTLQNIYNRKGSNLLNSGFPTIWNLKFLKIHNCVICSSVVLE